MSPGALPHGAVFIKISMLRLLLETSSYSVSRPGFLGVRGARSETISGNNLFLMEGKWWKPQRKPGLV